MSSLPKRLTVCLIALLTLSSLVTSVSTKAASPPESRTVASQARHNSGFNSAIAMLAPSSANKRAAARAIPDPDPVINATFPSRRPMIRTSFSRTIRTGCCAAAQSHRSLDIRVEYVRLRLFAHEIDRASPGGAGCPPARHSLALSVTRARLRFVRDSAVPSR